MYDFNSYLQLETNDIRRRYGTLKFEEQSEKYTSKKSRTIERPVGPVAMEITRHGPSQSHKIQHSR